MAASFSFNLPFKLPLKFSTLSFIGFSDSSLPLPQFDTNKLVRMMMTKKGTSFIFFILKYINNLSNKIKKMP